MQGVNPYLELLKEELLIKCSEISPSISTLRVLQKQDFELMAKIINLDLDKRSKESRGVPGTLNTISVSTLERIYKHGYAVKTDRRSRVTLDKLAVVVGYEGWDDFVVQMNTQFDQTNSIESHLVSIVTKANEAEFDAYLALPEEVRTDRLLQYQSAEGTAYKRIYNVLMQHSRKKWTLKNEYNPSGYIQRKIWIASLSAQKAIIKTNEYWYLRWFEMPTALYRVIYNEENEQTYTLELCSGEWKVTSVYYPGPRNLIHITHVVFVSLPKSLMKMIRRALSIMTSQGNLGSKA